MKSKLRMPKGLMPRSGSTLPSRPTLKITGSSHSEMGPFFQTQEITVRLDQEIETAGKRRLRTQAAELRTQAQKAEY